jgi:hypothetical protein
MKTAAIAGPMSVASILERERESTIREWLKRVNSVPELTDTPLSDESRMGHLPRLLDDIVVRLRAKDSPPAPSNAAIDHGSARLSQGYSLPMLVEESRLFQVCTFHTLYLNQSELDQGQVLLDAMIIADEADRQLGDTVRSFMRVRAAA